jgi:hypothetical protein
MRWVPRIKTPEQTRADMLAKPWRKVIDTTDIPYGKVEHLECGHRLPRTFGRGAKKRRCPNCKPIDKKDGNK